MNVVVIGAGLAGLVAAIRLREAGAEVSLLTKGIGGLQLSQGTVDVLGYSPDRVERPFEEITRYVAAEPEHPYAVIGTDAVREGVRYLCELVGPDLLTGDGEVNLHLPTGVGAYRPTAIAQPSMLNGALRDGDEVLIAGPRELKDFYPGLIAENLSRVDLPGGGRVHARSASFSLPARGQEADSFGLNYARKLDTPAYRATFAAAVASLVQGNETVGLPAILGLRDPGAWRDLQERIGRPIFEIPLAPPSVPGMRINERLTDVAKAKRVRILMNAPVLGMTTDAGRVTGVRYEVAGGERTMPADAVLYAGGGFESGALTLDSYGHIAETVLGLPVAGADEEGLLAPHYWNDEQELFKVGVAVDRSMRVLDRGTVLHPNLVAAGGILAGAISWSDKTGEGVALGSAVRAADTIMEELR